MRLVTTTYSFIRALGHTETIRLLARSGFDAIDWSFIPEFGKESPWLKENWKDHAKEMLDTAAQCSISFRQAHAPYPSSKGEEPYDTVIVEHIRRTLEASAMLGIEYVVVHPKHHVPYLSNRESVYRESVEFYRELIPYCQEYGVKVCCENMWQRDKKRGVIVDSICARPEEFCAMIDELDSPWITGCLDLGHCGLVSQDPADFIRQMGHDRLSALHVHDVDLLDDSHTMPFVGRLNWSSVTAALAEIGYDGDFTFEPNGWFESFPRELWEDAARMLERTGRYLIRQIEENK